MNNKADSTIALTLRDQRADFVFRVIGTGMANARDRGGETGHQTVMSFGSDITDPAGGGTILSGVVVVSRGARAFDHRVEIRIPMAEIKEPRLTTFTARRACNARPIRRRRFTSALLAHHPRTITGMPGKYSAFNLIRQDRHGTGPVRTTLTEPSI